MVKNSTRRSRSNKRSNRRSIRSRKSQKVQSGGGILGITEKEKQNYANILSILSDDEKLTEKIKEVEESIERMKKKLEKITYDERLKSTVFSSRNTEKSTEFITKTIEIMKQIPLSSQADSTKHFMETVIQQYINTNLEDINKAINNGVPDLSTELFDTLKKYFQYVIELQPADEKTKPLDKLKRLQEIYNTMYINDKLYRLIYTYQYLTTFNNKCIRDTSSEQKGEEGEENNTKIL